MALRVDCMMSDLPDTRGPQILARGWEKPLPVEFSDSDLV